MEKQKLWDELSLWVDTVTDALDMPVDKEIKGVVIGLNALGVGTQASCGGHVAEEDVRFPWVSCQAVDKPDFRFINEEGIVGIILDTYQISPRTQNMIFMPGNEEAEKEYYEKTRNAPETDEYTLWDKNNVLIRKKVIDLINTFNSQKKHTQNIKIEYSEVYPGCLIQVTREDESGWVKMLPVDQSKERIMEAQKEIGYFAGFLKETFFRQ